MRDEVTREETLFSVWATELCHGFTSLQNQPTGRIALTPFLNIRSRLAHYLS
jgi:hypothetical protein